MIWNKPSLDADVQKHLEAPMRWIGMYVATASLACTIAMSADALYGLRSKKYWFPSKYFSLNATSLTLLAAAVKLQVDLTTRMYGVTDRLAKVSSIAFVSTSMANFLASLGSMDDKDILMNVSGLGILVITVTANVGIQVTQLRSYLKVRLVFPEEIIAIYAMMVLFVMFVSSALMLPATKRYLETKYKEMHKSALSEEELVDLGRVSTEKLRAVIRKYWVMAETSTPQFVTARSVTCTSSGVISMLVVLVLAEAQIRMAMQYKLDMLHLSDSSYGSSTRWILLSQTVGVLVGAIAPASRWFVAINFRSGSKGRKISKSDFTVEGYWTEKMVEWKQGSLSFKIRHLGSKKLAHNLREVVLDIGISVQSLVVLASKLVLLVSVCLTTPIIASINYVRMWKMQEKVSNHEASASTSTPKLDIGHYVMLLEGEVELPKETLENICKEVDDVIERGKMHKPTNLLKLLHKSCNFNGVTEFDSDDVPCLHSQDLPYCWALPVVTLTSIALALPNADKQKSNLLLNSVTEAIRYVKIIDKALRKKGSLANIRTAADVVWVRVELYHKWQDKDLDESSLRGKNSEEILNELCDGAEKILIEFKNNARDCLMKNPLNWPAKVVAANSMYRISKTILLSQRGETAKTDAELFDYLTIMIADIMVACLTNLARVITIKCQRNAIEEREKSVHRAAFLLGETEEIIVLLQQRELPFLSLDQIADIEAWRVSMKRENKNNNENSSKPKGESETNASRHGVSKKPVDG